MPPDDGVVQVPVPIRGDSQMAQEIDVNNMLVLHCMNGAQITADGRSSLAEFTRLGHIRASDTVSFRESTGVRHVTESGANSTQANPRQ